MTARWLLGSSLEHILHSAQLVERHVTPLFLIHSPSNRMKCTGASWVLLPSWEQDLASEVRKELEKSYPKEN